MMVKQCLLYCTVLLAAQTVVPCSGHRYEGTVLANRRKPCLWWRVRGGTATALEGDDAKSHRDGDSVRAAPVRRAPVRPEEFQEAAPEVEDETAAPSVAAPVSTDTPVAAEATPAASAPDVLPGPEANLHTPSDVPPSTIDPPAPASVAAPVKANTVTSPVKGASKLKERVGVEDSRLVQTKVAVGNGDQRRKGSDQYNARMQLFITNKMKRILIEELKYLPDEVEAMMPDVAAVVINKRLERPRQGMPANWRKDFHLRERGWTRVKSSLRQLWKGVKQNRKAIIASVLVSAAVTGGGVIARRYFEEEEEEEEEFEEPWFSLSLLREQVVAGVNRVRKGAGM